ncbi:MAG: hypothetical protein GX070_00285 [Alcaligenaceae bacterium]|nr:hypothetical protein [Alcaligenaceae bacterium]
MFIRKWCKKLVHFFFWMCLSATVQASHVRAFEEIKVPVISFVLASTVSQNVGKTARVFTEFMHEKLGNEIRFMQMYGDDGLIGADYVSNSEGDGSVFLLSTHTTQNINDLLDNEISYSPESDFINVGMLGTYSAVLVVPANSPHMTLASLIEAIQQKPADYRFGYHNPISQICSGLLNYYAGLNVTGRPYKTREILMREMTQGSIQYAFLDGLYVADLLKTNEVRILATTKKQMDAPMAERIVSTTSLHPDFELEGWIGVAAPQNTPAYIIQKMNELLQMATQDPRLNQVSKQAGIQLKAMNLREFDQFVKEDRRYWIQRIQKANVRAN